jgi:hypothetical protein
MPFNITFSCDYEVSNDCIKYVLDSKTFCEYFVDEKVSCNIVDAIVACDEALKFLVEKLDDDEYLKQIQISCDETPEDSFCGVIKHLIEDNIDAIRTILIENESEESDEKSDESE